MFSGHTAFSSAAVDSRGTIHTLLGVFAYAPFYRSLDQSGWGTAERVGWNASTLETLGITDTRTPSFWDKRMIGLREVGTVGPIAAGDDGHVYAVVTRFATTGRTSAICDPVPSQILLTRRDSGAWTEPLPISAENIGSLQWTAHVAPLPSNGLIVAWDRRYADCTREVDVVEPDGSIYPSPTVFMHGHTEYALYHGNRMTHVEAVSVPDADMTFLAGAAARGGKGVVLLLGAYDDRRISSASAVTYPVITGSFLFEAWSEGTSLSPLPDMPDHPEAPLAEGLAVDSEGTVHVVWTEGGEGNNTPQSLYYAAWSPGRWNDLVKLSADGVHANGGEVALGRDGSIHAVWHVRSELWQLFHAYKPKGGEWSRGTQVTRAKGGVEPSFGLAVDNKGIVHLLYTSPAMCCPIDLYHMTWREVSR